MERGFLSPSGTGWNILRNFCQSAIGGHARLDGRFFQWFILVDTPCHEKNGVRFLKPNSIFDQPTRSTQVTLVYEVKWLRIWFEW
jgi:hypothetical protein